MAGVGLASISQSKTLSKQIEDAMGAAVRQALSEGVSVYDASELQARQSAARDRVKASVR